MANLSIRNLPDEIYREFKKLAKQNKRSVNNELIYFITDNFEVYKLSLKRKRKKGDILERIKKIRKKISDKGIKLNTVKIIREMRNEGRF